MLNGLENPHGVRLPRKLWKCSKRWLKGDNPLGGVLFYKSKFLVSCTWTCHDPVGHKSNSTVTTPTGDSTEHTEDEGLGKNICCSSASALCHTGNNDGISWNFVPLSERNLARRTCQPRTPWLRGAARKQQETGRKGRWNIKVDSLCDDDDFPSLEREADFTWEDENQLRKKYLLQLQCNGCHAFATGHWFAITLIRVKPQQWRYCLSVRDVIF